jgi:hypothetical protein
MGLPLHTDPCGPPKSCRHIFLFSVIFGYGYSFEISNIFKYENKKDVMRSMLQLKQRIMGREQPIIYANLTHL